MILYTHKCKFELHKWRMHVKKKGYVLDHKRSHHKFQRIFIIKRSVASLWHIPVCSKISSQQQRDGLCIHLEIKNTLLNYL